VKISIQDGKPIEKQTRLRSWIFLACIAGLYLILMVVTPDRAWSGLQTAGDVLMQAALPLLLAFGMMCVLNMFISPVHVSTFLGKGAGIRGIFFSALAGIISMGPIFAWYPFLESLREKGASDFHLANFLSHRAVKPVMLPMMIVYFGWLFSLVFTVVCVLSALVTATAVGLLGRRS
jgi:uncharacterized membrane protein YraQ (UPF0718 family)